MENFFNYTLNLLEEMNTLELMFMTFQLLKQEEKISNSKDLARDVKRQKEQNERLAALFSEGLLQKKKKHFH